ncbi:uncharacterized protein LY89DRAFT_488047 [Mollisia scopiformis]|uniref:Uncharacterized protein n=1 Tax=Mollisia scopiformis TaxID=149040 RepID=A0A194XGG3_MOLSC|nr:uncharacterized protein LY89DRAFT_488047 [Mollisia scopiformis]KUJ19285.1 hypothetical protein LY89DRAFT_488047 [Mollisia scopiformis]
MHYSALMALLAATAVTAVPLNINLGAYSPALVVGDGEISFGGAESAEALVNTLAGASAGTEAAAANTGVTRAGTAEGSTIITPSEAATEATPTKEKRDLQGFNAALNFATGALSKGPTVELGTGEGGSGVGITVKPGAVAKREEGSLPTVTLLKIRSLGNNAVARKARRAESVVPREVSVDDIDSINLNLDGDVEFTIAEVKP